MRVFKYALGLFAGFIAGVLISMLCTPLLWKLEPILSMELAGHSGPSDAVIFTGGSFGAIVAVFFVWRSGRGPSVTKPS